VVCRTIEIRGDQTLEELHECIFEAFDRDDRICMSSNLAAGGRGIVTPKDTSCRKWWRTGSAQNMMVTYKNSSRWTWPKGRWYFCLLVWLWRWLVAPINVIAIADTIPQVNTLVLQNVSATARHSIHMTTKDEEDMSSKRKRWWCRNRLQAFTAQRDLLLSIKDQVLMMI